MREKMPLVPPDVVIGELLRRSWVRKLGPGRYRSRAAETVRLLARLRQLWKDRQWESGPPLVADFRYRSTPRMVPRRTLGADEASRMLPADVRGRWMTDKTLPAFLGTRRLSAFQARAVADLLGGLDSSYDGASIVTAGTGAGKTLCFYLPALLARLADREHRDGPYIVAIYPRVELLRDQAQAAVEELQGLRKLARAMLGRPLSLGAYFGATPLSAALMPDEAKRTGIWECPFMSCWACGEPLAWKRKGSSWAGSEEGLECKAGCGARLGADEVRLTRASMSARPPDIVFTTMESLNNLLQNTWNGACIGLPNGTPTPPRFVLLDEVHTYGGVTGAQQALVLRRWRHALRQPGHATQFVGLSATIREPKPFMAALVGVPEGYVRHVEPRDEELEEMSRRYHVALRGDPISASALLSTTIQSLMLMARMIDPPGPGAPGPASVFGSKVFAFCDTLDVWRRLADDLHDAEVTQHLPRLRARNPQEDPATRQRREDLGQLWAMGEDIGHDLHRAAHVDSVSSRARGVAPDATVVVATSTLELGFDDPNVSVVLQHKAPRDPAAFVQRMGRAGRRPEMRPWIVCVLSDYGRDRLAYAAYEELFDPVLGRSALPVGNRYILRMQAGFALCDWLARQVARGVKGHLPCKVNNVAAAMLNRGGTQGPARDALRAALQQLVTSDEARGWLCEHLQRALRIEESVALDLMWQPPRGLLTEMVPTLLRILEGGGSGREALDPLAGFVPGALFSSLVLPQVRLAVPGLPEQEAMPVEQCLREYAPGRVSRRFGQGGRGGRGVTSHWIAPSAWMAFAAVQEGPADLSLADVAPGDGLDLLGSWECETREGRQKVSVFFPLHLQLRAVPTDVSVSSTALPTWHSQLLCTRTPHWLATPAGSALHAVLPRLDFLLHADNRSITARRFTTGSEGTISSTGQGPRREAFVQLTYRHPDSPARMAALGMQAEVDALALDIRVPPEVEQGWRDLASAAGRARRVEFYRRQVHEEFRRRSSTPGQFVSTFAVDRLLDLFLAGISARGRKLGALAGAIAEAQDPAKAMRIMVRTQDVMLSSIEAIEGEAATSGRLSARIEPLARDPVLLEILARHATVLHQPLDGASWAGDFLAWMRARTRRMVAEALLDALASLLPDFDAEDLCIDLDAGAAPGEGEREGCGWITESEPGGTGTLEALRTCYVQDPDRFMAVLAEAVRISPEDFASDSLGRVLDMLVTDAGMQERAAACRSAASLAQAEEAAHRLKAWLEERGLVVGHGLRSSIFLRFLRPGSSPATDAVTHALHRLATQMADQLGVEVDARCVAYVASHDESIRALMQAAWPGEHTPTWRFSQAYSLLWPSTRQSRLQRFQGWQPYLQSPPSDPDALLPALPDHPCVDLGAAGWFEQLGRHLAGRATRVDLVAAQGQQELLRAALLRLAGEAHEVDALRLHAEVEALARRADGCWVATVRIPDVFA
ncbi:MAG: protein DpdJ [Planctomycetia bacterium]